MVKHKANVIGKLVCRSHGHSQSLCINRSSKLWPWWPPVEHRSSQIMLMQSVRKTPESKSRRQVTSTHALKNAQKPPKFQTQRSIRFQIGFEIYTSKLIIYLTTTVVILTLIQSVCSRKVPQVSMFFYPTATALPYGLGLVLMQHELYYARSILSAFDKIAYDVLMCDVYCTVFVIVSYRCSVISRCVNEY